MGRIFAVIVTYNGQSYISNCIETLQESHGTIDILIVDNASRDNTLQIVENKFQNIIVLRLRQNLGFGRANNIGIKYAYEQGADHVLLLNQDARINPETVRQLVQLQSSNSEYGILSPLHLDKSGKKLDFWFSQHLSKARKVNTLLSDLFLNNHRKDIYHVDFLNAAIWMLSRKCIEKVGLFNPVFKHYGEDREYADRVNYHGLSVGIVSNLYAFHDRHQGNGEGNVSIASFLLQEQAVIRYRVSRIYPSMHVNILSAVSRIILGSYPGNANNLTQAKVKITLFNSLIFNLRRVCINRSKAYKGGPCFFEETDSDKREYLL